MMDETNRKIAEATVFVLAGCMWQRGTDNVHFSARVDGDIRYFAIPELEAAIQREALKRGITVGDMCDVINAAMTEGERKRMRESGLPYFEATIQLSAEQSEQFNDMVFGKSPAASESP